MDVKYLKYQKERKKKIEFLYKVSTIIFTTTMLYVYFFKDNFLPITREYFLKLFPIAYLLPWFLFYFFKI